MPTAYYGFFVNAAILLEWIHKNVGDDTLKNMETMRKLKIPSLAEVHSIKSLEAALPSLFGDMITFTGRQKTSFYSKVTSAPVWTNGSTGTKEFILTNLAVVVSAVRTNINQCLPSWQGATHTSTVEFGSFFFVCDVNGFFHRGKQGVLRSVKLSQCHAVEFELLAWLSSLTRGVFSLCRANGED
jgi:hypothetical protein